MQRKTWSRNKNKGGGVDRCGCWQGAGKLAECWLIPQHTHLPFALWRSQSQGEGLSEQYSDSSPPDFLLTFQFSCTKFCYLVIISAESWSPDSSLMILVLPSWARGLTALQPATCLWTVAFSTTILTRSCLFAIVAARWSSQWDTFFLGESLAQLMVWYWLMPWKR